MAQVNIRIDDALKEEGERLFGELGLNFSTAVSIFVRQSVREGGIPFVIKLQDTDPFYSEGNIRHLLKVKADVDAGRNIVIRDLIEG
ncbi:MAG: type II toxin-antitoxin system RelB/DinJ family antitoxin [Coriobacteriia bacterium]|nr:type II toxin-antitoxin system RelB/DinJ family antitoxin [Coriobacteriia bacterium]